MGLEFVRLISQCAGIVAVLALIGCFLAATMAVELSRAMAETVDDAIQLVRRMALIGAGSVVLAGFTSTFYWWRAGVASAEATGAMFTGLALAAGTFALLARRLLRGH
jgi:hypothetical protein